MADEKKKPWQFSLGRAIAAMTLICITLAASKLPWSVLPDEWIIVVSLGLGSTIGVFIGGIKGAVIGAVAGIGYGILAYLLLLIYAITHWY